MGGIQPQQLNSPIRVSVLCDSLYDLVDVYRYDQIHETTNGSPMPVPNQGNMGIYYSNQ
jgi:hypothetical protein